MVLEEVDERRSTSNRFGFVNDEAASKIRNGVQLQQRMSEGIAKSAETDARRERERSVSMCDSV